MNKFVMVLISAFLLLGLNAHDSYAGCDVKGFASGINRLIITLKPGVPHVENFDYQDCEGWINNRIFAAYVSKPRTSSGVKAVRAPIRSLLQNELNGQSVRGVAIDNSGAEVYGLSIPTISNGSLSLWFLLDASQRQPVDIEVQITLNPQ